MSQQNLEFDVNASDPVWVPYLSVQQLSSNKTKLLGILESSHPKTDRELSTALYPAEYREMPKLRYLQNSLGVNINLVGAVEEQLTSKVKRVIGAINSQAYRLFKQIGSRQKGLDFLYNAAELVVVVGETESGAAIRGYHGPAKRQPREILEKNLEWTILNREKQSQPYLLAQPVLEAEIALSSKYGPLFNHLVLNTDFHTPDEQMDKTIDDDNASEQSVQ